MNIGRPDGQHNESSGAHSLEWADFLAGHPELFRATVTPAGEGTSIGEVMFLMVDAWIDGLLDGPGRDNATRRGDR
jgi:hypothetical protein